MKCLVNLLEDDKFLFEKFTHGDSYAGSSAEISKLWETKKSANTQILIKNERANKKLTQSGIEVDDYWLGEEDPKSKWHLRVLCLHIHCTFGDLKKV